MKDVLSVFECVFFLYFAGIVTYLFILSLAGRIRKSTHQLVKKCECRHKIAVLIPAYKEDNVIVHTLQHALKQNYPKENFDIIVIADSLNNKTLEVIDQLPVHVIKVSFVKSTKVKALNAAFMKLSTHYDIAVILDADNLMEINFLRKISNSFSKGYLAIQGKRVAKNKNTSFALLDAISETVNNHIFRKGYNAIGLSASLIGSGMAFEYELLKRNLHDMNSVGGFDRELCLKLIEQGYKVKYLEDALVYDEKVEHPQTFAKQRRRWLSSQFFYLSKYFHKAMIQLGKGNFAYFEAAVIGNIILPRVLILGFLFFLSINSFFFQYFFFINSLWYFFLLAIHLITILIPIPLSFYNKRLLKASIEIPYAFLILFVSLFKLKNANKQFLHTPHRTTFSDPEQN